MKGQSVNQEACLTASSYFKGIHKSIHSHFLQLKAQIPVLKKAYLDEQSSHNEVKVSVHFW